MRGICSFLLVFSLLTACDSTVSEHEKNSGLPTVSGNRPFDAAAELIFTKHARCRMDCRHITAREIHEILEHGNINYEKSEPEARPDPKYAVEGYTDENQHLRIIVAPERRKLIVITCMELGVEWSCHCN